MERPSPAALAAVLLAVLLPLFYPALFLQRRLAPEAALHSAAPWRSLLGPYPAASPLVVEAASSLGPRLAAIAREPLGTALWNPWIGGGRGGWLASAAEGGTPLVLAAACLARPGWQWTALLALTVVTALMGFFTLACRLGFVPTAAAVGAVAYALSGAVTSVWLTSDGAALALGPFVFLPLLSPSGSTARRLAAGAGALALLLLCGAQTFQYLAVAAAWLVARGVKRRGFSPRHWPAASLAVLLALALLSARLWLYAASGEPGIRPTPTPPTAAPGLAAVIDPLPKGGPSPAGLPPSPQEAFGLRTSRAAFLSLAVLMLAGVGAARPFPGGGRPFWLAVTATAALFSHLPAGWAGTAVLPHRPFGAMALGVAVLAAAGTHHVLQRLPNPQARAWGAAAALGAVLFRLLPVAAHGLPFAPATAAALASPVGPMVGLAAGERLVALGVTLPPDTAAAFALPDLRAKGLAAEPRYAAALRPREDGTIPFDRALDPSLARLGARLLLEPAQLQVVSADLFSRTLLVAGEGRLAGTGEAAEVTVYLPEGVVRLALRRGPVPIAEVALAESEIHVPLSPDPALTMESEAWAWFALPGPSQPGKARLRIRPAAALVDPQVLLDPSGAMLLGERTGARLWLLTQARPFAFLARGLAADDEDPPSDPLVVQVPRPRLAALAAAVRPSPGEVRLTALSPTQAALEVTSPAPSLLVVMLKYRPALWRAWVNGAPATTEPVDGLWTGIVLPAGANAVQMRAHVPWWVLAVPAAGTIILIALAVSGGSRRVGGVKGEEKQ